MDKPLHLTPDEFTRLRPFFYHTVDAVISSQMMLLRDDFLGQAVQVLREQPASRSQSLALTHLEDALTRAIQGLALQGEPQLSPYVVVDEEQPPKEGEEVA